MYVATRQIKISVPGDDGKAKSLTIEAGAEIPGVSAWPYPTIIAHLNLGMMKWKGDEIDAPHNAHKQRGVVIPVNFKKKPQAKKADYSGKKPEAPAQSSPSPKTTATQAAPPAPGKHLCPACNDGKEFKNKSALSSHLRAKHPEQVKKNKTKAG